MKKILYTIILFLFTSVGYAQNKVSLNAFNANLGYYELSTKGSYLYQEDRYGSLFGDKEKIITNPDKILLHIETVYFFTEHIIFSTELCVYDLRDRNGFNYSVTKGEIVYGVKGAILYIIYVSGDNLYFRHVLEDGSSLVISHKIKNFTPLIIYE